MKEFENKIDAYLQDRMTNLEKELFEEALENDPEKRKMLEEHREAIKMIKIASLKQNLDQLEKAHGKDSSRSEKKSRVVSLFSRPQLIGIAASLLVLVVAAVWIFLPSPQSESQLAFEKYYEKDPGLPTTMGVSDEISLSQAMLLYKQGEYGQAEEAFDQLLEQGPSDTVLYYKAMTLIELENFEQAEKYLRKSQLETGKYSQRSDWYLAMVLLEQNQKEESIEILQDIANTDKHLYATEASQLINELKN